MFRAITVALILLTGCTAVAGCTVRKERMDRHTVVPPSELPDAEPEDTKLPKSNNPAPPLQSTTPMEPAPTTTPCEGKRCGDPCQLCPPDDATCIETAVVRACDGHGECAPKAIDLCGEAPSPKSAAY